jgi:hypothetical protein
MEFKGESLRMTREDWVRIGQKAGWTKTAAKCDCEDEVARIAKKHGVEVSQIEKELAAGSKIEAEHRGVYDLVKGMLDEQDCEMKMSEDEFFKRIALAHLEEMPDYYAKLKKMEEA